MNYYDINISILRSLNLKINLKMYKKKLFLNYYQFLYNNIYLKI